MLNHVLRKQTDERFIESQISNSIANGVTHVNIKTQNLQGQVAKKGDSSFGTI